MFVASDLVTVIVMDAQSLDALFLWALQNGNLLLCDFYWLAGILI